jgi:C1A family cysteine protease
MPNAYVQDLAHTAKLSDDEIAILSAAGVRSAEDVDALLSSFPSLANLGVRLPDISNAVSQSLNQTYANLAASGEMETQTLVLGAAPPEETAYTIDTPAPGVEAYAGNGAAIAGAAPAPSDVDLRLADWPVRNQADRGTCVAFGSTACVEHFYAASEGAITDLSEQFLYRAIKTDSNDPDKTHDGTWLQYARDMLEYEGICAEDLWPYVGTVVDPVSGATDSNPTQDAVSDAASREPVASCCVRNPTNAAAMVCRLLHENNKPVAICLAVFRDPTMPQGAHGWGTKVAWSYGRILNPPPTSVVAGGHCVCITGFVADSNEPSGGYFIFRNSWSPSWAKLAPSSGNTYSPEAGYGEISATYVDKYCWELMQL